MVRALVILGRAAQPLPVGCAVGDLHRLRDVPFFLGTGAGAFNRRVPGLECHSDRRRLHARVELEIDRRGFPEVQPDPPGSRRLYLCGLVASREAPEEAAISDHQLAIAANR